MANKVTVSMQSIADSETSSQQIYFNEPTEIAATFTNFSDILAYKNTDHILKYVDSNGKESIWRYNDKSYQWVEIIGLGGTGGGDGHVHLNKSTLDKIDDIPETEGAWLLHITPDTDPDPEIDTGTIIWDL